jgi:enoyl-CoA hydratase/carnithine racemase
MTSAFETMVLDDQHNEVATITFNRPAQRNAINSQWLADFTALLNELRDRQDITAIVVTGGPAGFCAGGDLKELAGFRSVRDTARFLTRVQQTLGMIERFEKPVVAAVHQRALGGGTELALCCDLIVAADDAQFGLPEILVGIVPGAGGIARLAKLVGAQKAKELVLLGRPFSAAEAHSMGLVTEVVASELVVERARSLASELGRRPPLAFSAAKRLLNRVQDASLQVGLDLEVQTASALAVTEDHAEGLAAFAAKRLPVYRGR